jgi:hypothetical protein
MALNVLTEKRSGHIVLTSNDINDIPALKDEIDKFMAQVRVGDIFKFRLELSFSDTTKSATNRKSNKHTYNAEVSSFLEASARELRVTFRGLTKHLHVSRATLYNMSNGMCPNLRTRQNILMNAPTAELRETAEKLFAKIAAEGDQ